MGLDLGLVGRLVWDTGINAFGGVFDLISFLNIIFFRRDFWGGRGEMWFQ